MLEVDASSVRGKGHGVLLVSLFSVDQGCVASASSDSWFMPLTHLLFYFWDVPQTLNIQHAAPATDEWFISRIREISGTWHKRKTQKPSRIYSFPLCRVLVSRNHTSEIISGTRAKGLTSYFLLLTSKPTQ